MADPVSNQMEKEKIVQEFLPMVYNLAYRLCGNPADAEDIAQDAFVKVFKSLERFRSESDLSTWIYRITVNTWKNRVRSEKRRGLWKMFSLEGLAGDEEKKAVEIPANEPAMGSRLEEEEKEGAVQKALLELEEEERTILVLRDVEEKSYEEISKALEVPLGTVKSKLFRARESLRKKLRPVI